MEIKIWLPCLLLLAFVRGQTSSHRSYDWRTTGRLQEWPKVTSLLPYEHQESTETYPAIHDSRSYHNAPVHYHDSSAPYPDDSYSAEYNKHPYRYPDVDQSISSSSYEQYENPRHEDFNMTRARIGGFAGSGDTKGFGAYDFPKHNHHEISHEYPEVDPELEHLMQLGRQHHSGYHRRDRMLIHPLPPPL